MRYSLPIATIVGVAPQNVKRGEPIELYGAASDSDDPRPPIRYEWSLILPDGAERPIGNTVTTTLQTEDLEPGPYIVKFVAYDADGQPSAADTTQIYVSPKKGDVPPYIRWTMLLYLDADTDPIGSLEQYLGDAHPRGALRRLAQAGDLPNVSIVALYDGPGGDNSYLYIRRPGGTLERTEQDEQNMGDPQTLVRFVRAGQALAPAEHYYLALADHANALDGIAWDLTSQPDRTERLTNDELLQAMHAITNGGSQPIEVLHLDGCLMGLLEIAYQLQDVARYLVVSENLAWGAFAYEHYRQGITLETTPESLAAGIVERYAKLIRDQSLPYTITALDLSESHKWRRTWIGWPAPWKRLPAHQIARRWSSYGRRWAR